MPFCDFKSELLESLADQLNDSGFVRFLTNIRLFPEIVTNSQNLLFERIQAGF